MKRFTILILLTLAGCSSTNITKLVQAAAKDPARITIDVRSPWGTVSYMRDNSAATNMTPALTQSWSSMPPPWWLYPPPASFGQTQFDTMNHVVMTNTTITIVPIGTVTNHFAR